VRIAAGVEYQGAGYAGWQRQAHAPSVQAQVERALSRVADHEVTVQCAGRTDSGVHAQGQVIHFDAVAQRSERSWLLGGNTHLPDDIALRWVRIVPETFHARFSAAERRYRYVILNRPNRSALLAGRVALVRQPLDVAVMHRALAPLLGEHDFSSFRAQGCQARHPNRCVLHAAASREGDLIYIDIHANAFLHHMVRNIVGSVLEVGRGARPETWLAELLALRDRRQAGVTAPAAGLYLVDVIYPGDFGLPVGPSPIGFASGT